MTSFYAEYYVVLHIMQMYIISFAKMNTHTRDIKDSGLAFFLFKCMRIFYVLLLVVPHESPIHSGFLEAQLYDVY